MLSNRFTAYEAYSVAKEANTWIDMVDGEIQKAVLAGETECRIHFCTETYEKEPYNKWGKLWYRAGTFFIAHYNQRGFDIEQNGQCSIIIKWEHDAT